MLLKRRSGMNPRQQTTVRLEKYGKVTIFGLPTRNWQYSGKQGSWVNPPNDGQSGESWESDDFWSPNSQLPTGRGKQGSWMNPPNERRSGRRKLGAAPLSQGCSEARAWYFLKEKEKREGEEEKETRRELRQYIVSVWNSQRVDV